MTQLFSFFIFCFLFSFGPAKAQSQYSVEASETMEWGLRAHSELIHFLETHTCEVGLKVDCGGPLGPRDLETLKILFGELSAWNKLVFENLLQQTDKLKGQPFELIKGSSFSVQEARRWNPLSLKFEIFLKISLDGSHESLEFINDIQITAASTLMMYDSFFQLSQLLSKAKKIRSILENDLGPEGYTLKKIFSVALDNKIWDSTENNLNFLKKTAIKTEANPFEQYIAKSFTASKISDKDFSYRLKNVLFIERILSQTQYFSSLERILQKISQIFGNTAGQVQTRSGKLISMASNPSAMKNLKQKLKPLDILLEKTPFRLTDQFIPGYFGHVAIWIGTPEEILKYKVLYKGKDIDLVDHPLIQPYLEQFSLGKLVVEALREPGVTVNTLEHFMDIDDFLVLRKFEVSSIGDKILKTIKQIGKPYDFNFDVETENSIVCSELVYTVFDDQGWPTSRSFGRYTIGPDQVAWKTFDSCLSPIVMYTDGKEIKQNLMGELRKVLEKKGGINYQPTGVCN